MWGQRMGILNLFLDLAAVSLWLSWRGFGSVPTRRPAGTLGANLRPVDVRVPRRFVQLAGFLGLVIGRAILYSQLGDGVSWVALWSPGAVTIAFRSDSFSRMLLYSGLSAVSAVILAYSWLIALSGLSNVKKDPDPISRALRDELKPLSGLPFGLWLVFPILAATLLWLVSAPLISKVAMGPPFRSFALLVEQSVVVGFGILPSLRIPLMAVVFFKGLAEFVYFGVHPFWAFVEQAGGRLCRPLAWFRIGRVDLAPIATLLIIWLVGRIMGFGFNDLKGGLSVHSRWLGVGVLPWLFERLPQ